MTITFTHYPDTNRVPSVYAEIDPSGANSGTLNLRSLLIGQVPANSALTPDVPVFCEGEKWANTNAGIGSMLALMVQQYRNRDTFGELWLLPVLDNPASATAIGAITFADTATASGTISAYIGGQRVQAYVAPGMTSDLVAASLTAACASRASLPATATATDSLAIFSANHAGAAGNDIDIRLNYLGSRGGEVLPPGITATVSPMTGGTANPDLTLGLLNLAEQPFDYIALPYTDTASLDAVQGLMADDVGRWAWNRMIYGHVFAAYNGSLGRLTTLGTARNDPHCSIMGFYDSPTPAWLWAADLTAACASSLRVDPALPLQTIPLNVLPPPIQSQFVQGDRNTLLYDGIATWNVDTGGVTRVERVVTSYQYNAYGAPDNSYLDVETMATLAYVCRDLRTYLSTQFARKKIVSDATRVTGPNITSPLVIRASVISRYRLLEQQGYVQNSVTFAQNVQVGAVGNGLVKILWPGDLVGQLRQLAILVQFTKST